MLLLHILLLLSSSTADKYTTSPTVHTTLGPIVGNTITTTLDNGSTVQVEVYLGIPYAASTAGNNRFRTTQARQPWNATRNSTLYGPGCPQADHNPDVPKIQSEDCLNLNVWLPTRTATATANKNTTTTPTPDLLPIGIFFHGGAFKEGSNQGPFDLYDGAYFSARSGVIVITANYRLGALGFLTSNDAGSVGNYGIQDQRFALQWVQDNAARLGGDKTKVTMWGESAGGMSELIHMLSPASTGLFSRIIMESNPAGYIYRNVKEASDFGKGFVKDVGCLGQGSPEQAMVCLRAANISTITKATGKSNIGDIVKAVLSGAHLLDVFLPYTPTSGTANIPDYRVSKHMHFINPVPLLIGTNRNEGDTFILAGLASPLSKLEYNVMIDAIFGITGDNTKVKSRYPPQKDSRGQLGQLVTDYWFRCASQRVAGNIQHRLNSSTSTFMYWYNHSVSFGPQMWPKYNFPFCVNRVCHGAELPFVFHNSANWTLTQEELVLSDYMVDAWGHFIKHEDKYLRDTQGWPNYNDTSKLVMALKPTPTVVSTIEEENGLCAFWDEIGYNH
jgi:carboxylesterase type B